jgi:hypothetical protein
MTFAGAVTVPPITRGSIGGGSMGRGRVGRLGALWRGSKARHRCETLACYGIGRQRAIGAQDRARVDRTPAALDLVRLGECHLSQPLFTTSRVKCFPKTLQTFLEYFYRLPRTPLTDSESRGF